MPPISRSAQRGKRNCENVVAAMSDAGDVEGGKRCVPLAADHAAAAESALSLAFQQGQPATTCLGASHA